MDEARATRFVEELTGKVVGGWTIESYVSHGKSAIVFKGSKDSKPAIIKVFDPELIDRFGKDVQLARIKRETDLIGKTHPNLVQIYDGGECESTKHCFVVMALVPGQALSEVYSDIPRNQLWSLISQIASAAKFLESLNNAHRDIKPANMVVSADFKNIVLLDLGVMRPVGHGELTDGDERPFVGTLQYSPPEFLLRKEEDTTEGWRAVTTYQIGAVLHDLIMKKPLFEEFLSPYARLSNAVQHTTPKVCATDVDPALVQLSMSCLIKDPKIRNKCVSLDSFTPPKAGISKTALIKDRIRKRAAHQESTNQTASDAEKQSRAREIKRSSEKVRLEIERIVHGICAGSELFPPLELYSSPSPTESGIRIIVGFGTSPKHQLACPLSIFFDIDLIDPKSLAITVRSRAALTIEPLRKDQFPSTDFTTIAQGAYNESTLTAKIEENLFTILDSAQQHDKDSVNKNPKEPLWLDTVAAEPMGALANG